MKLVSCLVLVWFGFFPLVFLSVCHLSLLAGRDQRDVAGSRGALGQFSPHMSTSLKCTSCPGAPWQSWHSNQTEDASVLLLPSKTRSLRLLLLSVSGKFSQLCYPLSFISMQKWHCALALSNFICPH